MKVLNTRLLGIIGIIGAPWMFIDFINNGLYEHFLTTSASGVRNFLFMTGWICSVLGLYKLGAMGNKRWQKILITIQLVLLVLADMWCIIEMISPHSPSPIYYALNFSWPLGGCYMAVIGIVILLARRLKGWKRFVPLLAGLWFPQTLVIYLFLRNSTTLLLLSGVYSTIVFSLLGFCVATEKDHSSFKKTSLYQS